MSILRCVLSRKTGALSCRVGLSTLDPRHPPARTARQIVLDSSSARRGVWTDARPECSSESTFYDSTVEQVLVNVMPGLRNLAE